MEETKTTTAKKKRRNSWLITLLGVLVGCLLAILLANAFSLILGASAGIVFGWNPGGCAFWFIGDNNSAKNDLTRVFSIKE